MASIREQLEENLNRFEELERQMVDPAIMSDGAKGAAVAREHGSLAKMATKYRTFKQIHQQINEARALTENEDPELREMAAAEIPDLTTKREALWLELLEATIGGEDANRSKCVMEIRAGVGGEEAALFAGDLFRMYKKFGEIRGWKVELMDASPSEHGGFKEVTLGFDGEGSFRVLQYESGGHRVQRVPETEAKGRVHTSAATVAVMAEPDDVEVNIKSDEYRKDTYAAGGPGGQHVNKTESAVRLTHYATGIVVQCQDERSQHKNLAKALRVLKSRIYEHQRQQVAAKRADMRKTLVGSGDRSQRIRTYNFPDNRVTDHRINFTLYKLDQVIDGNLQPVTDALIEYDRNELRSEMGEME